MGRVEDLGHRFIPKGSNSGEFKNPREEIPIGKNPHLQDPEPVEIFNSALEGEPPFTKTPKMLRIEEVHGKPIQEILWDNYRRQRKSSIQTGRELGVSQPTVLYWLRRTRIGVRPENGARINKEDERLVEEVYNNGRINTVTEKEGYAIKLRFIDGMSLDDCARILGLTDRRTAWDIINRGLKKLKMLRGDVLSRQTRISTRLTMIGQEGEFIRENPSLPVSQLARLLGHSESTVRRWRDELGLPRTKVGRPRK